MNWPVQLSCVPNTYSLIFLAGGDLKSIVGVVLYTLDPLLNIVITMHPCELHDTFWLVDAEYLDLAVIAATHKLLRLFRVPVKVCLGSCMLVVAV